MEGDFHASEDDKGEGAMPPKLDFNRVQFFAILPIFPYK